MAAHASARKKSIIYIATSVTAVHSFWFNCSPVIYAVHKYIIKIVFWNFLKCFSKLVVELLSSKNFKNSNRRTRVLTHRIPTTTSNARVPIISSVAQHLSWKGTTGSKGWNWSDLPWSMCHASDWFHRDYVHYTLYNMRETLLYTLSRWTTVSSKFLVVVVLKREAVCDAFVFASQWIFFLLFGATDIKLQGMSLTLYRCM